MRAPLRNLLVGSLVCLGVVRCLAQDRSVSFMRLGSDIVQQKVSTQPMPEQRVTRLRKLFVDAGCSDRMLEQPVANSLPNLICSTPGAGNSLIVVAASLDYSATGDEAALRWGDLAMLPILAESLSSVVTRHSLVFVGFSGNGNGLTGAKSYIEHLTPEQRKKIDAIVAFDQLGRAPPAYSVPGTGQGMDIRTGRYGRVAAMAQFHPSDLAITRPIANAAQRWNFDVPDKTGEYGANITKPFHQAGIAAITFTSPAWTVVRYIGEQPIRDYRTKLDFGAYDQTYLFLSAYLLYLDRELGKTTAVPVKDPAEVIRSTQLSALQTTVASRKAEIPPAFIPPAETPPVPPATTSAAATTAPPAVAPADATTPVFRATSRLVQVDVVATDKHGRPLEGLKREDFTIFQDGHLQNARVFEVHLGTPPVQNADSAAPQPHYLGGTYSNAPNPTANQSWTVILFDMLNTPTIDQQVARNQLKNIATSLPDRQPIALFLLSSKLVMVQAFTTNTRELMAAVDNLTLQRSQVLTTEAERQHEVGTATYISQTSISPNIPAQAGVSATTISDFQQSTTNRALQSIRDMESLRLEERVMFTLDAFAGLSRAMAGYPGRKNLIWLSGNFPLRVEPNSTLTDKWRNATNYMEKLGRTMALLAQSRVAVYPVDVRGMQVRGVDISTSTAESAAFVGANGGSNVGASTDRTSSLLAEQTFTGANERETMVEVAEQTGGRAFINTNDFAGAIARAINDGASYYTLAYTPDTKDDKPSYHRIEVKLKNEDAKLSYRRGYYSEPEVANPQTGLAALQGALQPGMPPSTMLFFTAAVKAPEPNRKTVQISYLINGSNVTLTDAANGGKHIVIDCMAIAFDKEGKEVAHASDTLDGTLPASAMEAQLTRGLPATQELELKPGMYNVRVGVQDRASQRIGTVSIPVLVQ